MRSTLPGNGVARSLTRPVVLACVDPAVELPLRKRRVGVLYKSDHTRRLDRVALGAVATVVDGGTDLEFFPLAVERQQPLPFLLGFHGHAVLHHCQ